MAIHADSIHTDVSVIEEEGQGAVAAEPQRWEELEKMRSMIARMRQDRRRTAAEGFDD
jgi:hypothetical protein